MTDSVQRPDSKSKRHVARLVVLRRLIIQACKLSFSMYPATDEFLSSVRSEIRHQIRRLQHHPSLAIIAANNENEVSPFPYFKMRSRSVTGKQPSVRHD